MVDFDDALSFPFAHLIIVECIRVARVTSVEKQSRADFSTGRSEAGEENIC